MNQTSLVGRPLYNLFQWAEKRGYWNGPYALSSSEAARLFGGPPISTGMSVTESTAFTYSVFWACVNNISTDVAAMPLKLFKRLPNGGKEEVERSKLNVLLSKAPNPEMSAFTFRGLLTSNALTYGMGYAEIVRDGGGMVRELWPITPDRVSQKRYTYAPYYVYYDVTGPNGGIVRLERDQMFVLPGSTYDGVYGRNIVDTARESIGLGLAAERFGGTFFGNGATFGGVFEHPGRMSEQAQMNFKKSVNSEHQGVAKAHKFIVAEEGMKYQRLGIDPNAAQFLETRQHQVEEMCRWFRMPPHKVQHLIRTSYNSVEHLDIEYAMDTLQPRCVSWEQELLRQLVSPLEWNTQFFKHNMDSRLRGDVASRHEAYAKGIQHGYYCADDIREKEDLNPLPNGAGKKFFFPQNMVPADRVDEVIDKQVEPAPKPVAPAPAAAKPERDDTVMTELRAELATVHANLAETMAQLQTATAASLRFDQFEDLFKPHITTLSEQIAKGQAQEQALQALLLEATQKAERLAAEKEAQRLEAEAAAEIARADIEAAKQAAEDEAKRLQTEHDTRLKDAAKVADMALADLDARCAAAESSILRLTTDLADATKAQTETSRMYLDENNARGLAQTQLAELQAVLAEAQAERDRLVAERDAATHDAHVFSQKSDEAQRAAADATAQLAKTAQDADEVRALLNDEHAKTQTEALKQIREAHMERLQHVAAANRDVWCDAVGRIVRVEVDRARRNQGTPAKLKAWAEAFSLQQEERYLDALRPLTHGHLVFIGSDEDADTYTRRLIAAQWQEAVAQLRMIADGDPEDYSVSLERLLTKWERERPAAVAGRVFHEEMTYVRSL